MDLERRRSNYARTMLSGLLERTATWLGLDDDWERPRPALGTRDVVLPLVIAAFGLFTLELVRSLAVIDDSLPVWGQWLVVASGAGLLVWRRRWPLVVTTLASLHMFVTGVTAPDIMGQLSLQIVYFVAIFSGVAWARDRRVMAIVVSLIVASMFAWIAWQFVVGSSLDDYLAEAGEEATGTFGPVTATVLYTFIINGLYFGGAVVAGAVSWQGARQRADLTEQTLTIASQAEQLRDQALVEERLRIARELHDVVAHHVSAMGVQAGAARRVLSRDPEVAAHALAYIEDASRDAVTQMRGLLGTLRDTGTEATDDVRTAEPGVDDIDDLLENARQQGVDASYTLVQHPEGAAAELPRALGLSIYRTVQEALTNVARHSTANRAHVAVRVDTRAAPPYAEVEVVDDGRPREATSGSGLGQLGIRERAATHRAQVDIGPRVTGGYRVRVRYPLGDPG
jgi:signal transduction histidine kinase